MRVSIVVFEYNEVQGMRHTMPQIDPDWYDELIVVDGGSTDGTVEYCRESGLRCFTQTSPGVGGALDDAMRQVTGDLVIIYAPDGSFLPNRIPVIIENLKRGADVVNVSRYMAGAGSEDDTFFTGLANRIFSFSARLLFRWHLTDFLYTYLGFHRDVLTRLEMYGVKKRTWGQILLMRAFQSRMKITEIFGQEPKRVGGDVKVPKIRAACSILRDMFLEFGYRAKPGISVDRPPSHTRDGEGEQPIAAFPSPAPQSVIDRTAT